ncbi:uncharacterized protein LOC128993657 [Macrosteles quadrilineatus]|uniref:uncharacterized protein LOC128993657 n=1 Tax=Macrosteles quadrilineatus TaxID=74068 RepID=UPI0023E0EF0B|nr:uncharacterized protein LOC128993657 [Macrosteles quadrilineatus]
MVSNILLLLLIAVCSVLSQGNRDWHIGADRVNPSGTVVHGHANIPLHRGNDGRLDANVHGSRVFGGPYNRAQTVGGGLQYQHNNGLHGGVDATNRRGVGTSYSATVGGHTRLGPGTLSVDGGAARHPGSSRVQGQVGATYNIPF